jgi:type II secretory pathway component PulF
VSNVRVRQSEIILFTTQLSVMLDSGVVLSDAMEAVSEQMHPGVFRDVLQDVAERIKNGESFSSALSVYPKVFNTMFVSMVKASEATGKMGTARCAQRLPERRRRDPQTVKGAMIYR